MFQEYGKRCGRPKKVKTPSKQEIIKYLNEKHSTSRELGIKMNLFHSTVINYAHQLGFNYLKSVEIPKLKQNHKILRSYFY